MSSKSRHAPRSRHESNNPKSELHRATYRSFTQRADSEMPPYAMQSSAPLPRACQIIDKSSRLQSAEWSGQSIRQTIRTCVGSHRKRQRLQNSIFVAVCKVGSPESISLHAYPPAKGVGQIGGDSGEGGRHERKSDCAESSSSPIDQRNT